MTSAESGSEGSSDASDENNSQVCVLFMDMSFFMLLTAKTQ